MPLNPSNLEEKLTLLATEPYLQSPLSSLLWKMLVMFSDVLTALFQRHEVRSRQFQLLPATWASQAGRYGTHWPLKPDRVPSKPTFLLSPFCLSRQQRSKTTAWWATCLICTMTIDFPAHLWSPLWPVEHPGSCPNERSWVSQGNHFSHFFLETGDISSEHKLSAAFAARAFAFYTTPPLPILPFTYFIPAGGGLRYLPLSHL